MTIQAKPNSYRKVWAATGTKIAAEDFKISRGWEVEKPPYEVMNWLQNRQDQWIAHANQRGIAMWDADTEYKANVSYVTGAVNGLIYRATADNTNTNPETDVSGKWVKAFDPSQYAYSKPETDSLLTAFRNTSNSLYLKAASNLSDLASVETSRNNLGVFSKTEVNTLLSNERTTSDGKYLQRNNNLSDLGNLATARNNLSVYSKLETYQKSELYSKVESDNTFLAKTDNLAGLVDKAASRTNLGVYSTTEVDSMLPAGMIIEMPVPMSDPGWVYCDGRSLSRTANPRLFARIGTSYGAVDGNSFNVPDYRGIFRRGFDGGRGIDPGRVAFSLQQAASNALAQFESAQNPVGENNTPGVEDVPENGAWSGWRVTGRSRDGNDHHIRMRNIGTGGIHPTNMPVYVYMKL